LKSGCQSFVPYSTDNRSTTLNGITFISCPCSRKEPTLGGGGGNFLEKLGGGGAPLSQTPYLFFGPAKNLKPWIKIFALP